MRIFERNFGFISILIGLLLLLLFWFSERLVPYLPIVPDVRLGFYLTGSMNLVLISFVLLSVILDKHLKFEHVGLKKFKPEDLAFGCLLLPCFFVFNLIYNLILTKLGLFELMQSQYLIPIFNELNNSLLLILVAVILAPISEELFFRGFLLNVLWKKFGFMTSAVISSLIFAAMHKPFTVVIPIFALSMFFSLMYRKSGSILPGMILHIMVNGLSVLLYLLMSRGGVL